MTLDKIDLLDRKFSHSLVGYRRDEVDRLLAEAADSIGRLAEEKMALGRANDELRREMAEHRAREATLRDTLLATQQIVHDLKIKARQEAERIVDEARDQAASLLSEAKGQVAALAGEIDALAARKAAFLARFRDMLLAALDIFDAQTQTAQTPEASGGISGEGSGDDAPGGEQFACSEAADAPRPTAELDALDPFAVQSAGKR